VVEESLVGKGWKTHRSSRSYTFKKPDVVNQEIRRNLSLGHQLGGATEAKIWFPEGRQDSRWSLLVEGTTNCVAVIRRKQDAERSDRVRWKKTYKTTCWKEEEILGKEC